MEHISPPREKHLILVSLKLDVKASEYVQTVEDNQKAPDLTRSVFAYVLIEHCQGFSISMITYDWNCGLDRSNTTACDEFGNGEMPPHRAHTFNDNGLMKSALL